MNKKFFISFSILLLFYGCSEKPISEKQKAIDAYKEKQKKLHVINSQSENIQITDEKEKKKLSKEDFTIFYIKCMEYILQEEFEEAKRKIERGLSIYQTKKDFKGSLENLLGLLELVGNNSIKKEVVFNYCKGKIFHLDDKLQQAIDEFQKVIEKAITFGLAYTNLGVVYLELLQYQEALDYFKKGIQLEPNLSINYLGASTANYYLGQYQQAIDYALKGIQLDPNRAEAHIRLGSNYNAFGKREQAVDSFKRAIELDSSSIKAYLGLGSAYSILGHYEQATDCFSKVIQIKADNAGAYFGLALVYHRLGQYKEAKKNLQKAKELYSEEDDYRHVRTVEKWLNRISLEEN